MHTKLGEDKVRFAVLALMRRSPLRPSPFSYSASSVKKGPIEMDSGPVWLAFSVSETCHHENDRLTAAEN